MTSLSEIVKGLQARGIRMPVGHLEWIARMALARVVGRPSLWSHFANTGALAQFWKLPVAERYALWGDPFDPTNALRDFDPKYIHDGMLGVSAGAKIPQ